MKEWQKVNGDQFVDGYNYRAGITRLSGARGQPDLNQDNQILPPDCPAGQPDF